ncbi:MULTISPECIES: hypothetical protein [Sphingobacterium]|uniref:hypothetical protein n=1 Tax=Sphingobacterium TaxID=28453 RepID=UPI000389EE6A|nr:MULTISPECIES: hypothetical protein [Sphingobacterium]KKX49031.1 hypothetical protein L950_0217815 [Sphingobacterium sp. IITKGP-BTPF85]MCW2261967.1 Na+-transporting methylmalonyl-CoA/oxaloacetate decarboxylase gamma subunit [Sphingobacterium kitahiroshimense]NJI75074.1 hypothetical protein [Sphingobacterium sp. B16(2022)]TCR13284.1 putative superfamily III holin-X [Sphingobacterium sp. JUb78]
MEEEKFSLSGTFQKTKEYLDSQLNLIRLKTVERSSRLIASLIVDGAKIILTLFIIFFLCLALGFYLGEVLGSNSLGFLATAVIFLVILLLICVLEPKLETKFMDLSIRRFSAKWDDESDEEENNLKQENLEDDEKKQNS